LADTIVRGVAMPTLLDAVDEVHTITSLTGFEALLRGLRVVAYGQPFYAGWGLTEDRSPPRRRTRTLTRDELVAGALILYPRYLDPLTGLPCPPEVLIERLTQAHLWTPGPRIRVRAFYGMLRKRLFGRG
jgi:capsular polysaccharide export protein